MDEHTKAKNKAADYLARRRLTRHELRDKLKRAGFEDGVVEDVLDISAEYGYVNDLEYAKAFIEGNRKTGKYGRHRVVLLLEHKGIDRFTIEDALAETEMDSEDEYEKLCALIADRLCGDFSERNVGRVTRHFAARGYDFGSIRRAIRESGKEDAR